MSANFPHLEEAVPDEFDKACASSGLQRVPPVRWTLVLAEQQHFRSTCWAPWVGPGAFQGALRAEGA